MAGGHEALVYGGGTRERLVAVECRASGGREAAVLFLREGEGIREEEAPFSPFLWVTDKALTAAGPEPESVSELEGSGELRVRVRYRSWAELQRALQGLRRETGRPPSARDAPYFAIPDPVQQYLTLSGETLFKGMALGDLRRMQLDIETRTGEGYDFPNAERASDRILAIGMADSTGWSEMLALEDGDETALLERFVRVFRERDPDVIEGHNIFAFDLPYLIARAHRCGVGLALGRDGGVPRVQSGRFTAGERATSYPKVRLFGRSIVDTYFLAQIYDVSHRSLPGLGLKDVARHFGLASRDRTYIRGSRISETFDRDPQKVLRYLRDDVAETRGLADLFLPVYAAQARLLPFGFQDVCLRGQAAKIEALLLRAYSRDGYALPLPGAPRSFQGGYTDIFRTGVVRPVHHCDIRSLYPSVMLARGIGPARDERHAFLDLLENLRAFRLDAKRRMQSADRPAARREADAIQSTFKVLINSFYGYLGFEQARFSDFEAAEAVTAAGRGILRGMIGWIRDHGGDPVEIDTDGIYFVPPETDGSGLDAFRHGLSEALPEGIEVEFDGEYEAMFSYKMKNYALRTKEGEILMTGAALKSRGLEPFQRAFVKDWIEALLTGGAQERAAVNERYRSAILSREWDVRMLAKSERLQEAPAAYAAKRDAGRRARNAAMELALAADREYRAGDTVRYYVTGTRKSVPVHAHARLVSQWDPSDRDENVAYYAAKLDALVEKFESFMRTAPEAGAQGTLDLGLRPEGPAG